MEALAESTWISSRQAADILGVHESSVKRWCNASRLNVSRTSGGHRRIQFSDLMNFVRSEGLECALSDFAPDEFSVWQAGELAQHGDLSAMADLFFQALFDGDVDRQERLLAYAATQGSTVVDILQYIFAPALRRIGSSWAASTLDTGDEHRMSGHILDCIAWLRRTFGREDEESRRAIVGCPTGETHTIGAEMVRALLESRGWRVVFLGADTPAEDLVHQREKFDASLMCLSVVPPRDVATASRVLESINRLDPDKQYDIVLGGGLRPKDMTLLNERAGQVVEWFDSLPAFDRWLAVAE